eukprot:s2600_g4.t1
MAWGFGPPPADGYCKVEFKSDQRMVRQCPLQSGAGEEAGEEKVEEEEKEEEEKEDEEEEEKDGTLLKSSNPHLAGGEKS